MLFFFVRSHNPSRKVVAGWDYHNKLLKMRKLHKKCATFPAFQSTILRTFFELAKVFAKKRSKKLLTTPCWRHCPERVASAVHFNLKVLSASAASCLKRLYQSGRVPGLILGALPVGLGLFNGLLIMAAGRCWHWLPSCGAVAGCNKC